jgi:RNA-directed DNA polymerase
VVQAALKLVLEPILEADFMPCSYGFRPNRRAQDAIQEVRYLAARSYAWVLEADTTACFDEIDHAALLARVRRRVGDKRVLALVKAFLKAGISARMASNGTPAAAPRKAGSCLPCSATSPCRSLTNIWQGMAGDGHRVPASRTTQAGRGQLATDPLRGRLRGHGGRHPHARPGATR